MSSNPESGITESKDYERLTEETSQTQALDERTTPTSALTVEPGDEVEHSRTAYGPAGSTPLTTAPLATTPVATTVAEPVPLSFEPSFEPSGQPPASTGWVARGVRMRTVVLGLVLLAVAITSLLRVLTDVRIDDSLVVLILLVVAGVLLLGGGVASAVRESRTGRTRN